MRTDEQRIAAYAAKYYPADVALKVAAALSTMKSSFSAQVQDLVDKETETQVILNDSGVPSIRYPYYLNFARELWKMKTTGIQGDSGALIAQSLHNKYERYGLTSAVLIDIADSVFGITVT